MMTSDLKWEDLVGHVLQQRYALRSLVCTGRNQAEFISSALRPVAGGEPLSVTLIKPEENTFRTQLAQIATARRLAHPNLLRVFDGGQCEIDGTTLLFVVAETAGATLAQQVAEAPLQGPEAAAVIKDLTSALVYLHAQGLVCGALGPDTVVRAAEKWKIADLSQLHPPGSREESSQDVWDLGATLRSALAEKARRTPVFDTILSGCLQPDPGKRPPLSEIIASFENEQPSTPIPTAGPRKIPSGPRRRIRVLALALPAFLFIAVLAAVAIRKQPAAVPAKAPSTAERQTASKQSPAQSQVRQAIAAPERAAKHATEVESKTRSTPGAAAQNVGRAGFFADTLNGRRTASGEVFSNAALTAAHPSLPFGSRVRITNLKNGRSVVVRVNDRAPRNGRILIMVTRKAAERLGFVRAGSARVNIEEAH